MKLKSILASAAVVLLLAPSCSDGNGKSDKDNALKNASTADSLMYYFGQMRAGEFWRIAQSDTTFKTEKARADYLAGVKAGLTAVRDNDDVYNQGVFTGMQLAMNLQNFDKTYHQKLNPAKLIEGLQSGLASDTAVNELEAQTRFQGIMARMNEEKEKADRVAAVQALATAAKKAGLSKISDDLYGKVETEGSGENFKDGQTVSVELTLTKEDEKDLGLNLPNEIRVGDISYLPKIFTEALTQMKPGETEKFMTTANALFGVNASQMNMNPDDVMILTIKAKGVAEAKSDK